MWYIILALIAIIYSLLYTIVPSYGIIGSYIMQPILWISLGIIAFLIAENEGINILSFKRIRRWYLGNSPIQAGLMLGGFQVSILILIGIIAGFGESPFAFTPLSIIQNIFFVGSFIVGTEISRSYLINKGSHSRKHLTLILILTTIIYMCIRISPYQFSDLYFNNPVASLEFLGTIIITGFSMNLLASYLSYLGGAASSICYMGTLMAFEWFSPILPNPHWTITAMIGTIVPAIGFIIIQNSLQTSKKKKFIHRTRRKTPSDTGGWTIVAIFSLIMIFFSFGLLGVTPTVISSGSMNPSLQIGDIVLIDEVEPEELREGDIIQYVDYDNVTLILHRLIKIIEEDGKTYYETKGDANNAPDLKPITKERIKGKTIFTIPKIGWIQIIIKNTFKNINIAI